MRVHDKACRLMVCNSFGMVCALFRREPAVMIDDVLDGGRASAWLAASLLWLMRNNQRFKKENGA